MSSYYPRYHTDRSAWGYLWLVPLIALLIVLVAWRAWRPAEGPLHDINAALKVPEPRPPFASDEAATIEVYEKARPSVVNIKAVSVRLDFLGTNVFEIPEGTGSGFVWDKEHGYVVTNFHVIQRADAAKVTLADDPRKQWDARLVGAAPDKDLAVLKINAPSNLLHPLKIGTSKDLRVGQKVLAIGNPFGLDQSLTTGVISALGREIKSVTGRPIQGMIQTDAAINPGNSGGPLLDSAGRLIGVNTAIYSPSGAYAGVGFAIPVDTVNQVVTELIRHGKVTRPGLGISIVDDRVARRLGIDRGVLIREVLADGAAAAAGLQPTRVNERGRIVQLGDIILAIDGKEIEGGDDLLRILDTYKVGDTVKVTVLRDLERRVEVEVTLQGI
ncbi:MAG: trypsin-like peptidase domain-containing protein [Gemmataceae bacterium]|nr:trypsin-like peptidase domain-containing protein [Gemmataceae bacterium]MDW8265974.1 trypsin-like peptidase domain-containing protein [Gemmataceae bacterium]